MKSQTKRSTLPFHALICVILFLGGSFTNNPAERFGNKVMIYGISYIKLCNTETYGYYTYKLVDEENYYNEQRAMETDLGENYPNAVRNKVSSSKYDFGVSAKHMCIIKWTKNNTNCSYDVLYVAFGASEEDAYNRAIKQKNSFGGTNVSYDIVVQKYW